MLFGDDMPGQPLLRPYRAPLVIPDASVLSPRRRPLTPTCRTSPLRRARSAPWSLPRVPVEPFPAPCCPRTKTDQPTPKPYELGKRYQRHSRPSCALPRGMGMSRRMPSATAPGEGQRRIQVSAVGGVDRFEPALQRVTEFADAFAVERVRWVPGPGTRDPVQCGARGDHPGLRGAGRCSVHCSPGFSPCPSARPPPSAPPRPPSKPGR
jgi:hypothetical protein